MVGITTLIVNQFRNYSRATVRFQPGLNALIGKNAQGKTSLLEAIAFIAIGRSFRTPHLQDMIQKDKEGAALELRFEENGLEEKLTIGFDGKTKRVLHNATLYPSLSALVGLLPVVIMTPDDALIDGPPASRRQFLDILLSQLDPLYIQHLGRYQKAMRQRNHLLRKHTLHAILPWEQEMARSAAYITQKRRAALLALSPFLPPLHEKLSGTLAPLSTHYTSKAPQEDLEAYYLHAFSHHREKETLLGMTLTGPHRDDFHILLEENELRYFASEGQKKTALATLRLAAWELLKQTLKRVPLLLIDDFGDHLDAYRKEYFIAHLQTLGQVILTTVDPIHAASCTTISIKEGAISYGLNV